MLKGAQVGGGCDFQPQEALVEPWAATTIHAIEYCLKKSAAIKARAESSIPPCSDRLQESENRNRKYEYKQRNNFPQPAQSKLREPRLPNLVQGPVP